ncbi:MAG: hypothetical protein H8E55_61320 [Pelagibacterales bacterium]|nr:hypothetical protein [Pelagibacterales bacterium]
MDNPIDILIQEADKLNNDFLSVLPDDFNELELVFCVQTLITYLFWGKLINDEKVIQEFSSKYLISKQMNWSDELIKKYVNSEMFEKGNYRTSEYRSALQPGSENTFLLVALMHKNL